MFLFLFIVKILLKYFLILYLKGISNVLAHFYGLLQILVFSLQYKLLDKG